MTIIKRRVEGYWYSSAEPYWPKPVVNSLNDHQAETVFDLIRQKEKTAYYAEYTDHAVSRIEKGVEVGNGEYVTDEWRWPNSLAEHYVKKHRVRPSEEFLSYIGYHD